MTPTSPFHSASPFAWRAPAAAEAAPREDEAASIRLRGLIDAHHDFLWRGLRRLGVPESEVDDALQMVFVAANTKLAIVEAGRERGYLFGIAVRIASNARRSEARKRRVFTDEPIDDLGVRAATPADLEEPLVIRDLLEHALDPLPMELRTVFVLFELEEMTAPEIASLLGLPIGTVSSRLRRAREMFAARAEELRRSLQNGEET
jgi:RNA polymerase sigma-70 factor, ECF subfamily